MVQREERSPVSNNNRQDGVEVTFYTDPLDCWTWAMQPQWERIQKEMVLPPSQIKYKMGGLLPSWRHFNDAVNSIRKPVQMGPEWMLAGVLSGRKIDDKIWITDPPASSFPACIAVKCVELQSHELTPHYLNALQEAVMVSGRNIAKTDVLLAIAGTLADLDLHQFQEDLLGGNGKAAFRKDLQECKYLNIRRLPTILFRTLANQSLLVSGYQSYESLRSIWKKLDTSSTPR